MQRSVPDWLLALLFIREEELPTTKRKGANAQNVAEVLCELAESEYRHACAPVIPPCPLTSGADWLRRTLNNATTKTPRLIQGYDARSSGLHTHVCLFRLTERGRAAARKIVDCLPATCVEETKRTFHENYARHRAQA